MWLHCSFINSSIFSGRAGAGLHSPPLLQSLRRKRHVHHLAHLPLLAVAGRNYTLQARTGCPGPLLASHEADSRAMPDHRGPALHDHQRAAGDIGQLRQRLGGGDRRGDGDGVDDAVGHVSNIQLGETPLFAFPGGIMWLHRSFINSSIFSGRAGAGLHSPSALRSLCWQRHIHHLAHSPLLAVACHHNRSQARIIEGDGGGRRAV